VQNGCRSLRHIATGDGQQPRNAVKSKTIGLCTGVAGATNGAAALRGENHVRRPSLTALLMDIMFSQLRKHESKARENGNGESRREVL
jgi:hypothetical protein